MSAPEDRLLDGRALFLLVPMLLCMAGLLAFALVDLPPLPGRPW